MSGDLVPAEAQHLIEQLAAALGVDRLRVFGGAALDLLSDPRGSCHDIDVALPMRCWESFRPGPSVRLEPGVRPYWIHCNTPVVIATCHWHDITIDVNFLDEVDKIGHFDVERVWWDYPDLNLVDPHGVAFEPVRTFHLTTTITSDNPLLLLNRVIKLSAKYGISFWSQEHLRDLIADLALAIDSWVPPTDFHGPVAHSAHLRAIASSVRRAPQPEKFLTGCVDAGVFDIHLGLLAQILRRDPSLARHLVRPSADEVFWATADTLVGNGEACWRRYRKEKSCSSAS